MHLILTHEQTDFDALASLLGAYLLNDTAIPVLPRRINRNLRAFLMLYGMELPFVEYRDLPSETVESLTLVDTQSLVSVRGVTPETRVTVIDHHEQRADLPANWEIHTENVGANTTLFVESLQTCGLSPTPIQATLLLLGIYEDTGSLTYSRTTVRDVRAAAYLLEQGASLSVVVEYVNHPLSLAQEEIYRRLHANIESHRIRGNTILISHADARHVDEELSTLAHKLRNALEPDGLFLLLLTRSGVQLIARALNERVDAGGAARHFGGGGHQRAAAALIRNKTLEEVRAELLEILPGLVRPPLSVSQIMSRGPQVLSPNTPISVAAAHMQRYGYEGYPIVENGKVIGLLTRRAIDRALTHKLNLPVRSLMQAGNVSVAPDDSIEHLQDVMTHTGWGQIPVVSETSGKVIGIVTRTDLLKTLTPAHSPSGLPNLAERLNQALPPERLQLLQNVVEVATEQRTALFIVGGFVRDLLLNHPGLDFDLVVEGDAIAIAETLQTRYGGHLSTHRRFGTAKWFAPPLADQLPPYLDLISARTEFYTHPTALPTVERGSIKLDLHRRDFTINTLALRLDGRHYGELHDYWGGMHDLRRGIIRVLHSLSFVDDPTRMLRAVRFEQRFGFHIDGRTLELLGEALPLLGRVSGERIRHELDHILDEPRAVPMLARLHGLDILHAIHPQLPWDEELAEKLSGIPEEHLTTLLETPQPPSRRIPPRRMLMYLLWLLRLPKDSLTDVMRRLRLPQHLEAQIQAANHCWHQRQALTAMSPARFTFTLEDWRMDVLALQACQQYVDASLGARLQTYQETWQNLHPYTTGDDIKAAGLPPGPLYKDLLTQLRTAWLDGEVHSPEEERRLCARLIEVHRQGEA
ncbi:MAG: CBS domain-containing protein [Anaerolineales bacterium]